MSYGGSRDSSVAGASPFAGNTNTNNGITMSDLNGASKKLKEDININST
jgi:hypothetical protein